ncbi:MAG: Cu(I)-responsive transcriptional regulator [Alphaproteobacteria bacterium]
MNIKEAATLSGLPTKTIRYYEEQGLIKPKRAQNGYRDFSENEVNRLQFLFKARILGFTIATCRDLLGLYDDKTRASADVKKIALEHMQQVDVKIAELQGLKATLLDLTTKCQGNDRPDCPIIDTLANQSNISEKSSPK